QRYRRERPGGEKLAERRLPRLDRQSEQQLDRPRLALLRPEPHRDRGHQEEIEPGMEVEERLKVRLTALEEIADIEGQRVGERQKDDDEDIGHGRREIARQFT